MLTMRPRDVAAISGAHRSQPPVPALWTAGDRIARHKALTVSPRGPLDELNDAVDLVIVATVRERQELTTQVWKPCSRGRHEIAAGFQPGGLCFHTGDLVHAR